MARIRVDTIGQGQHPSEVMVTVSTRDGTETLIVDRRSVQSESIDVGYPIGSDGDYLLVELPRETMTGEWRVLVAKSLLKEDAVA